MNVDGKPFIMPVTNTTREEAENEELQSPVGFIPENENTLFVGSRFPKYIYAGEELPE